MLVSCACGCKRLVTPKPAYFSKACRIRANVRRWRKAHAAKARALNRKHAAAHRLRAKKG